MRIRGLCLAHPHSAYRVSWSFMTQVMRMDGFGRRGCVARCCRHRCASFLSLNVNSNQSSRFKKGLGILGLSVTIACHPFIGRGPSFEKGRWDKRVISRRAGPNLSRSFCSRSFSAFFCCESVIDAARQFMLLCSFRTCSFSTHACNLFTFCPWSL